MTPSRARGRKGSKRMWAVFDENDQITDAVETVRAVAQSRAFKADHVRPVTVTFTVPTKPKPRKAKP